jgi:signal transduction histidine kinase
MGNSHSIYKRLVVGLGGVGLCSSLLLLAAVFVDYHLGYSDLATSEAAWKAWHEVFEHVVLPALLFVIPIALAVIVVVRRALLPLESAAREIEAARGKERGFRLEVTNFTDEARPFAVALNDLLERLDRSAAQHEAFSADVAHELRTPLALARLELAEIGGAAKDRLSGDLQSMQRLVDQLLLLAQVKATEAMDIPHETQNLAEIGRDCVALLAPAAIAEGKQLAFEGIPGSALTGGWREAIQAAVRNLVENALRVTPEGGTVLVVVGPGPCLCVRDEGPGLSADDLDRLVHRNARAEGASRSGAGLGLAIVEQIMRAHGGSLATSPEQRELCLQFPDFAAA